jgi:hypothetical protein
MENKMPGANERRELPDSVKHDLNACQSGLRVRQTLLRCLAITLTATALVACGGSGGSGDATATGGSGGSTDGGGNGGSNNGGGTGTDGGGATTYTVGGTLSGLSGGTLVLQNNGGSLSLTADGGFAFGTGLASGATYGVTVLTQPSGQTCTVSGGSGTVGSADVTSVSVNCKAGYPLGGTLSGLNGTVVLQDNGGDNLSLSANGDFTFASSVPSGSAYAVNVVTQPTAQTCAVTNGAGTAAAQVANVSVVCTYNSSNSTLSDNYTGVSYGITTGGVAAFFGALAQATLNNGNYAATITAENVNGSILRNLSLGSSAYSVSSTGLLTITPPLGGNTLSGAVLGANGNAYIQIDLTPNSQPSITIAVRPGSGMTQSGLAGTYTSVGYAVAGTSEAKVESIIVDTSGRYTSAALTTNDSGTISVTPDSGSLLVTDGTGALTAGDDAGAVSADGNLFVLTDIAGGAVPAVAFAVKQGSGASIATLSGSYTALSYRGGVSGGAGSAVGSLLSFVCDGKGNYTGSTTVNDSGTISTVSGSGTYSIQPDGTLALDSDNYQGAVSADGNVFVLADVGSGDTPQIIVGIRQ